jgi:transposase InsO family protein
MAVRVSWQPMKIFNKNKGIEGISTAKERGVRFRYMIQEEAKRRATILDFWKKYGLEATKDAFKVSERTLFRWQDKLKKKDGKLEALNNQSRAPKTRRVRRTGEVLQSRIIYLRTIHPRIGKSKLNHLLKKEGFRTKETTVGRILDDLKKKGLLPLYNKVSMYARTGSVIVNTHVYKKKLRRPKSLDECVQIDTVVRFVDGIKRYIVTAINTKNRFAFAYTYTNHSSLSASDFIKKLQASAPFPITHIQTDNGSEFAYHFREYLEKQNIVHYHIYPRHPNMNAHIERFNRSLSEEFIKSNRVILAHDLPLFNQKLIDYMIYYNTERPHYSLSLLSPLEYIMSNLTVDCQSGWTYTVY